MPIDDRDSLTIRRPDDWHVHLRDGAMLAACAVHTARQFGRAIIMPNLVPPVTKVAEASAYRARIRAAVPKDLNFEPLMTCYLTDGADPAELARGKQEGVWVAAKLYPAHATTNSAHGVTSMDRVAKGLEAMEKAGMPLLVHGEVTDPEVDIFDREAVFLDKVLAPLLKRHEGLRIVLEHITTKEGVAFVEAHPGRMGGTITPHHLSYNRNAIFKGGIRPHFYCLPIAKREEHRLALRRAATSGGTQFFLGTDTAPHTTDTKECACGCAGVFNAPALARCFSARSMRARLFHFRRRYRIGAVIGRVVAAGPVVARKPDAAERRRCGQRHGGPVPVDYAGADIGPEAVVFLRGAADQRGDKAIARAVRLGDRLVEIVDANHLEDRAEQFLVVALHHAGDVDDRGGEERQRIVGAQQGA
jgi:dihydroorotase